MSAILSAVVIARFERRACWAEEKIGVKANTFEHKHASVFSRPQQAKRCQNDGVP
jgi:hypothetical protein